MSVLSLLFRDALQGLLRKLGAGFEDIMPSGGMSSSQLKVSPLVVLSASSCSLKRCWYSLDSCLVRSGLVLPAAYFQAQTNFDDKVLLYSVEDSSSISH